MTQLRMILKDLAGISEMPVPPGFALRKANLSDAPALAVCLQSAFPDKEWPVETVIGELLDHSEVSTTFVIEAEAEIAATASCKTICAEPEMGYVHWVAVAPSYRGRALGTIVSVAVLRRFADEGKTSAILDTDDERLPALKTYFKLGFEPLMLEEGHLERWRSVKRGLAQTFHGPTPG